MWLSLCRKEAAAARARQEEAQQRRATLQEQLQELQAQHAAAQSKLSTQQAQLNRAVAFAQQWDTVAAGLTNVAEALPELKVCLCFDVGLMVLQCEA